MKTAIRKHAGHFGAVIGLAVLAALVGGYILHNQRMRFPWEGKPFQLQAAFSTAQAVTPGQGQTVRVSGVRVGDITKVGLKDGHAVVTLVLDPEYKDLVHTDATALLRPKTGLKDMFIELDPGTDRAPLAKRGWTLPVSNTLPDVNPDEILASLDSDTRDYLTLLVDGAGRGLKGRGNDLREVFRRFEPTHRDLARVNGLVAQRHQNLSRLVHSLGDLNDELAGKSDDLAALVDSSSAVFRSFASEQANVTRAVGDLPGALRQTTDTLGRVQRFAETLRPAAVHLQPALKALNRANGAVQPFAKEAAPIVHEPDPALRARRAAGGALDHEAGRRAGRLHARPDELVHRPQPPLQPRRLQPQRPRGPEQGRPRGGLPVLDRVAAAQRRLAVLDLRRQRAVPRR